MLFLAGLLNKPIKKVSGVFSVFGQHLNRYQIEHLYGLIHLGILIPEINHPSNRKSNNSKQNKQIDNHRTISKQLIHLHVKVPPPLCQHSHQGRPNKHPMRLNNLSQILLLIINHIGTIGGEPTPQFRVQNRRASIIQAEGVVGVGEGWDEGTDVAVVDLGVNCGDGGGFVD